MLLSIESRSPMGTRLIGVMSESLRSRKTRLGVALDVIGSRDVDVVGFDSVADRANEDTVWVRCRVPPPLLVADERALTVALRSMRAWKQ